MTLFAYKDSKRQHEIKASQAKKLSKTIRYYCPNPYCDAHLHICLLKGSKGAYFRATEPAYGHVRNCYYGQYNSFNKANYDETRFDFDDLMDSFFKETKGQQTNLNPGTHGGGNAQKHPIRTLSTLYKMCKSLSINETYGNKRIWEMLVDQRSLSRYPNEINGGKLIEANVPGFNYNDERKNIYLEIGQYQLILDFNSNNDDALYKDLRKEVYNNKGSLVVVAGNWRRTDADCFTTLVTSRKQLAIIIKK